MPTYIILGNFTQKGLKTIKNMPKAVEQARKVAKSLGGDVKELYFTLGRYDFIAIAEGPDVETIMKAILTTATAGTFNTETLTAIPTDKVEEILKELP
ncbi:MAG: GYD domain-containing protein [Candidatus Helarchaeota archaeon]|nr:GYD domain-containing protein [Candidatus Helarchaeota archaeon]